jgi:hypothetical protein
MNDRSPSQSGDHVISGQQLPRPVEKIAGNQTSRPRRDEADHFSNDDAHNS